jgi:hypothetical protein
MEPHYGLDIAAPMGSPIRNWWAGSVQDVINDGGCGLGLVIRSGDYEHIYCHLSGRVSGGTYSSGQVLLRQGQDSFLHTFGAASAQYMWESVIDAAEELGGRPVGIDALGPLGGAVEATTNA